MEHRSAGQRLLQQLGDAHSHLRENDSLLIHHRLLHLRVPAVGDLISEIGVVERIKEKQNARGAGHVLSPGRIGGIAARLEMLAGVVVKDEGTTLSGFLGDEAPKTKGLGNATIRP